MNEREKAIELVAEALFKHDRESGFVCPSYNCSADVAVDVLKSAGWSSPGDWEQVLSPADLEYSVTQTGMPVLAGGVPVFRRVTP